MQGSISIKLIGDLFKNRSSNNISYFLASLVWEVN